MAGEGRGGGGLVETQGHVRRGLRVSAKIQKKKHRCVLALTPVRGAVEASASARADFPTPGESSSVRSVRFYTQRQKSSSGRDGSGAKKQVTPRGHSTTCPSSLLQEMQRGVKLLSELLIISGPPLKSCWRGGLPILSRHIGALT